MQVRQLLKIPLYKQEITVVEHTSVNEEWSQRPTPQFETLYPELKPEGYVPVSKHSVSPWELVEGAKGGCNVVPWQELGGVRYDRQPDKMEERLIVSLRGHAHELPSLEHEQVTIPNAPKPKVEPQGVPPQQFLNFQTRPPLMMAGQPRMIRPMQAAHFSGIMGAPAPNVTITQQGPVPNFNPHEQVPGQFPFDQGAGSKPQFTPTVTGQQQIFDNTPANFIDNPGGMVRTQYSGQRMMIPQRMTEEQKRQLMESQQQKVRLQGHPGMVFQTAQPPGNHGNGQPPTGPGAQAPPPYLQQHLANPNLAGAGMEGGGNMMNPGMMNQPPPHQFLHRPMMAQRPPMSLPVSMAPISSGNMSLPPSNPGFSQTSFFDQQFT
ncbi:transcription activator BRG1-like isoform X2 [Bolinopsis microptera]|uniref:transcription activator BRG1-like isoform X2 n=1 Tax=Bolinopsis microptera TaxID=2820187 RepID=UPI00307A6E95